MQCLLDLQIPGNIVYVEQHLLDIQITAVLARHIDYISSNIGSTCRLLYMCNMEQTRPIISGSVAERDLQLKASYLATLYRDQYMSGK